MQGPAIDYAARYHSPADVLADPALPETQKRVILEQWLLDEERRAESTSEGMDGGEPSHVRSVAKALETLTEKA